MASTFTKVSRWRRGYKPDQVDNYLARAKEQYSRLRESTAANDTPSDDVARVAFKLVRGGYDAVAVDAALDRLQAAFVKRQRAAVMARAGRDQWLARTYEGAQSLYPRLKEPYGARFAGAVKVGYHKDEVDDFIDLVAQYFAGEASLTADQVRTVTFSEAKREDAYDQAVVDAYLDRLVAVLLAVE